VPVIALVAFGTWYGFGRASVISSAKPTVTIAPPTRPRPRLPQESFAGFLERTWFVVPLVAGCAALARWLGSEPDILASLFWRTPFWMTVYGYIALAYLARDIWRVRKPFGALLIGRGGWAGIKAAHASACATRSTPKAA
ncbi:MAG: hypothetical protein ABW128_01155, partial [Rhizorhabdus sp.]